MSYLSATENVGFSGIPQNISDASCATQYKMAVEGASGNCSEVMYIPDNSADESTYITHLNDNYYTKFKIDPNELYTFHDSDVIAGEITVSHTEDTFMLPDSVDTNSKDSDCPNNDLNILGPYTNGDVKQEIKKKVLSNGHCKAALKTIQKESKTPNTQVQRARIHIKEVRREPVSEAWKQNVQICKTQVLTLSIPSSKSSININSVNTNNGKLTASTKPSGNETFLDVFKREQGLTENEEVVVKSEPQPLPPPPPPVKIPTSPPKKISAKTISQPKVRKGRGPAVHEALQRISVQKAIAVPNRDWHAPGDSLFDCGPLDNKILAFRVLESSSSDEDNWPDFESDTGPVCVEESACESRGARLAMRRAALRRHVARAHESLRLAGDFKDKRTLASVIKKQLVSPSLLGHLPTETVNHLLAKRRMPSVLTTQERRKLREVGWCGGESGSSRRAICGESGCEQIALPSARHCLAHVTSSPEQRLYAACSAVFAGGARCRAPLLPLHEHTPLCAEHAWKRDNYDKLVKDNKPKKVVRARLPAVPRRAKRRRRPQPRARRTAPPTADQSLSEINVCSNSSAYDSTEDTPMGALSENEYIAVASHELEVEVGHVPADDILDPAVLNQIPDEAFTEFFNEGIVLADGEASFGEGEELEAVLDAVLDDRRIDERVLDDRGIVERDLDDRGIVEVDLDDRGVVERELDDRGMEDRPLDDRIHEEEVEESLETMDHDMVYHSTHASVRGHMQILSPVPMEVSPSASS